MGLDQADRRPPYQQIAAALRQAIRAGSYAPGDLLPSARVLAEEYGVAIMTVRSAIGILRDEGIVQSWQGKGVVVRGPALAGEPVSAEFAAVMSALERLAARVEDVEARLDEAGIPAAPDGPGRHPDGGSAG